MSRTTATTTFLAASRAIEGGTIELVGDEARHASTVLRVREGDMIKAVDGEGATMLARVYAASGHSVKATVESTEMGLGESSVPVRLYLAIIKSRSRLEVITEKIVELGVAGLVLVNTKRSEKTNVSLDRLIRIVRAATKQCGRSRLMQVVGPLTFDEAHGLSRAETKLVCHEQSAVGGRRLVDAIDSPVTKATDIWVGPEGGFSDSEVDQLVSQGGQVVGLGPRRMRAETAGLFVVSVVAANIADAPTPTTNDRVIYD